MVNPATSGAPSVDGGEHAVVEEPVGVACYSCRCGTIMHACERPEGGWMYDPLHGWRCPVCSEAIIESLRSEVAELQRSMSSCRWLVRAVKAHMPFWQRVSWASERAEKDILAAIEAFEKASHNARGPES